MDARKLFGVSGDFLSDNSAGKALCSLSQSLYRTDNTR